MTTDDAVLVEAVRTPIGRRDGALSGHKPVALLRHVLEEVLRRAGVDPSDVDQVLAGCVSQIGEQSLNIARNAWLATGFDPQVGCTTVDTSCGSAQQANHLAAALIVAGAAEVVVAAGVESMSRVPAGSNAPGGFDEPKLPDYPWDDPHGVQFGGAERMLQRYGLTRAELDDYGARSQQRAALAWSERRFDREVAPLGDLKVDEGLRPTTAQTLSRLRPVMRGGNHTAGTSSQVSDGAAALLWMSARRARQLGLRPRARLTHQVVTGSDPYLLLDGPNVATEKILARAGLRLDDIDVAEVNEAFAAVVLGWIRRQGADPERVNPNGGAIAIGHPLGASGSRLLVSALHELERTGGRRALVTMCCGGAQGTASLLEVL